MTLQVSIVVEQLRRRVAAGVGRYATGLLDGLVEVADPSVAMGLVASRAAERPDPLSLWDWPVHTSRLPGPLLTRLWDRGWARPRPGGITHATSFAYPRAAGPLTVMVHDVAFLEVPEAYPARGRRWHERRLAHTLAVADRMIVPASRTADALVGAGAEAGKVVVIPEGADHLPVADEPAAQALVDGLGVGDKLILTVGTLEPRKNLHRLFDAFVAAGLNRDGWNLVVVGAAGWGEQVDVLPDGIVLAGNPVDAVLAGLYAKATLFAYVPLAEGFGLPPVEAMRAGVPVLASTEVPSVGVAAMMAAPHDTDAIAGALRRLADDPGLREELAARGLEHAGTLTWRACAAAHLDLWRSLE